MNDVNNIKMNDMEALSWLMQPGIEATLYVTTDRPTVHL